MVQEGKQRMPVEVFSLEEVEKKFKQQRQSHVAGLPEFTQLQMKLPTLKPSEAMVITLTPAVQGKLGKNPRGTFKRHTKKLLKKLKLDAYTIRGLKDGDDQILIITHEEKAASGRKR
jgi:hypothetical protein